MNPELTQLTLVDLRPAKTYNLRMFATNSLGTSHTSNILTITTKEAGRAESHRTVLCIMNIFMDSLFCWIQCVLSTRRSSSGHAAGEPHCSQHQSHVEGQSHTSPFSLCCVLCQIPTSSSQSVASPLISPPSQISQMGSFAATPSVTGSTTPQRSSLDGGTA